MYYNSEPIMSWITYVRTGVWKVVTENEYSKDPDSIIGVFEELMKNEFVRECNEAVPSMFNVYKRFGPISVVTNPDKMSYSVYDNFNNLMRIYNGIYSECNGFKLCLDTKAHGFPDVDVRYFKYCQNEDERFISLRSIVEGKINNNSQNLRRLISILYSRFFQFIENVNPEQRMFMDYTDEEKLEIIKKCENYDGNPRRKNKNNDDEE